MVCDRCGAPFAGLAAALALGASGAFLTQALVVEVYALCALCVALTLAETYGRLAFEEAPMDAVLVANRLGSTDVFRFPLLYQQVALQRRPDLLLLDRGLLEAAWYRGQLERKAPELGPLLQAYQAELVQAGEDPAAQRRASRVLLRGLFPLDRPVLFTDRPGPDGIGGRALELGGVLWWPTERARQAAEKRARQALYDAASAVPSLSPWAEELLGAVGLEVPRR